MADVEDDWEAPRSAQPQPGNYAFDLDRALASVVGLSARIPPDAFTAATLGVERAGNGVLIGEDGVVLTIGYLIAEAQEIWLTTGKGRVAPGHVLGYDQATGFGLVQALGPLDIPALPLGDSRSVTLGERVVIGGAGGRRRSVAAHLVARQEFAGYWEYVLDEALFTAPAHPNWGGTAMIGPKGDLLGIGSLQVPHQVHGEQVVPLNMVVPIELMPPILDDLRTLGRANRPPRPWLGLFAAEVDGKVVVVGFAGKCPAQRAGLHEGDAVLAVAGAPVQGLADFFRRIWALGNAGVEAPLTLDREGDVFEVRITSADRRLLLKTARFH
ncbi:S1C family serine protease [Methylocapsa polymorpha]|uniref:S1C family serine protease n=1 Tax=Methylocapsa polymorpha TaxID=3080828 RepID=A0ABZ0HTS7_9HYPH|nr:S1C family serine protease [Methylocapsa sp. RX1]